MSSKNTLHDLPHKSELAVKPAHASKGVYCELIGGGQMTEQILKQLFFCCQDRGVE